MPTFNRTALYCKEDGIKKRIPWDLIQTDGSNGGLISPMPVSLNPFSDVDENTAIIEFQDLFYDDDESEQIDPVVGEQLFASENMFIALFEGTTGYYDGDETQSAEFGYPSS